MVKAESGAADHWQRFFDDGTVNVIQCAEQLEGPVEILQKTYSNCTWQDETLGAAQGVARQDRGQLVDLGLRLGLCGYPDQVTNEGDTVQKTALQYIENHDHSRFVCNFGTITRDNEQLLQEGNRDLWYKVQPYLVGLFTARGIPLLWQGQEFGENYYLPTQGWGRVMLFRPVRWDYFYDAVGKSTIRLVRKLLSLRRQRRQFRHGEHYFYNHYDRYLSKNVLLFSRTAGDNFSLVALNFGDEEQWVPFPFPQDGDYQEELHGADEPELNLTNVTAGQDTWIRVPSNYGRIWTIGSDA
jgi:1,4-alpha-glucan branching enzyme